MKLARSPLPLVGWGTLVPQCRRLPSSLFQFHLSVRIFELPCRWVLSFTHGEWNHTLVDIGQATHSYLCSNARCSSWKWTWLPLGSSWSMVGQNRQQSIVTPWQDGRTQMLQREINCDGLLIGNQDHLRLPSLYQAPTTPWQSHSSLVLRGLADSIGDQSSWLGTVWILQTVSRFQDLGVSKRLWKKFLEWFGL
jgi:hypothetical protein